MNKILEIDKGSEIKYIDLSKDFWIERCLLAESMLTDSSETHENYKRWNDLKTYLELPMAVVNPNK